jgi:septal ring factor EnvC (AmiA/AmiB activator)
MRSHMYKGDEKDQFEILEAKVESLIRFADSMKKERESLLEKVQIQEEKMGNLNSELVNLKAARDKAKQRIVLLLEKLDQIDITD